MDSGGRVDQKIGSNDNLFGRFKLDHGLQPTLVDPISPNFSALSNQPSWDLQVHESHTFNSTHDQRIHGLRQPLCGAIRAEPRIRKQTFPTE